MRNRKLAVAGTMLAVLAATAMAYGADDKKDVYDAFAVQMGGAAQGASAMFEINITRWSTNEERLMLLNTLEQKVTRSS